MLISIIIPTRNRFDYVNLLVDDILHQDIDNYEIIVVDQSDPPQKIKNCTHIVTDSLGPCVSRNIGAEKALGDILVFLDDDARIGTDFIREITTPIISDRFDVVAGAMCDPEGNYIRKNEDFLKNKNANFIKVITSNPDAEVSRITLAFPGCCSAILKSVFSNVGGFDESYDPTGAGEDREMALKLFKFGYAVWYNSKAKLLHTVAPFGGTRDVGSRTMMLDVHTYRMCKKYFSNELAENLKGIIMKRYRKNLLSSILRLSMVRTKYKVLKVIKNLLNG